MSLAPSVWRYPDVSVNVFKVEMLRLSAITTCAPLAAATVTLPSKVLPLDVSVVVAVEVGLRLRVPVQVRVPPNFAAVDPVDGATVMLEDPDKVPAYPVMSNELRLLELASTTTFPELALSTTSSPV